MSPDEDPTTLTDTEKSPPPFPSSPITQSSSNLNAAKATETQTHRYAAKTRENYNGHIERGKKYAAMSGPDMAGAFDSLTIMTPVVLRAFVSHKCNENGFTYKTAEGIRSAFKRYFEETFQCHGDYWKCDESGKWDGNPVFDHSFSDFMASLKNRDGRSGV
ncbi:hypothetical protein BGZ80_000629, partial [Entomortierella chlamydospora]